MGSRSPGSVDLYMARPAALVLVCPPVFVPSGCLIGPAPDVPEAALVLSWRPRGTYL